MGRGLRALIFGGAVGAALGILYAPRSGKKTRAILAEKTDALWGQEAQDKGTILGEVAKTTKTAVEAGQNIFNVAQKGKFGDVTKEAAQMGQKLFHDTSNFVGDFTNDNVRPVFSEKNDELRKKIDTARAKIATQVAKNISEDKPKVKPATKKAPKKAVETKKVSSKKSSPKKESKSSKKSKK